MGRSLEYIVEKFPDHRATIINLYNKDEDFRTLCDDYLTSAEMLEKHRQNTIKDRQLKNDYSELYIELEKEIIHVLATGNK